jgi:hypothetical protein
VFSPPNQTNAFENHGKNHIHREGVVKNQIQRDIHIKRGDGLIGSNPSPWPKKMYQQQSLNMEQILQTAERTPAEHVDSPINIGGTTKANS